MIEYSRSVKIVGLIGRTIIVTTVVFTLVWMIGRLLGELQ
jgi:hypothetical protein